MAKLLNILMTNKIMHLFRLENSLQLIELLILSGETHEASEKLGKLLPVFSENVSALQQISFSFHDMSEEHRALEVLRCQLMENLSCHRWITLLMLTF